jgi:hypothetical protein
VPGQWGLLLVISCGRFAGLLALFPVNFEQSIFTGVFMKKIGVFFTLFLASIGSAHAVLNAGVATGFTALQDDALELIDLVWPVTIAVTVAFIILMLFKKAASKAV